MKRDWLSLLICLIFTLTLSSSIFAQGTTAPISGLVTDPTGATVPGATVTIKNNANGAEYSVTTASNGSYTVPSLTSGTYNVIVEAVGFKKALVENVKLDVGVPATVNTTMEVGGATETVVIQGGAEVLQTQSATISTTITGRQITETPFVSRDALDLVLLLPGTNTPGRPRTSTINGLPKGAINITIDGVNVQDNMGRSSDGFFTYIRPRTDAIEEVTVSTANPGAESGAQGAVQIKFITRSGNNEYHGSVYEYHRNPALNSNYWFNNRSGLPRDRILLNQYGFRVGGPISVPKLFNGRDKAFFFINYEEYKLPEQYTRNRTILNSTARSGIFRYKDSTSTIRSVNLYDLAASKGYTSTVDPTISRLLGDIQNSTSKGSIEETGDLNRQSFLFTNSGGQTRYFPTTRFDFNLTSKHRLEHSWNYQYFTGKADFLNNADSAFPGFPNEGRQGSNRFSEVLALRSTLSPTITNELRAALTGGSVIFFTNVSKDHFDNTPVADQDGYALGFGFGLTSPTITTAWSKRNTPVWQFDDTVSWTRGSHSMNFGATFTQISFWSTAQTVVPSVGFGILSSETSINNDMFNKTAFPNSSDGDLGNAKALYALLTGRVTSITANAFLDEQTGKYSFLGQNTTRGRQREFGVFAQDTWRAKSNITLTGGLRIESQRPFVPLNDQYAQVPYEQLWGISGKGNLFMPGVITAPAPQYTSYKKGTHAYNSNFNNFAPSIGFSWSPNIDNKFLNRIFGQSGQSVFRGGYSIAYTREGMSVFTSIYGGNPGASISASRNNTIGNLGTLPLLYRDKSRLEPPTFNSTAVYPSTGIITDSVNAFNPNIKMGYVQSWSFGIQREINKNTVIEARYVANRGVKLWQRYNLNEINTMENGFIDEFKKAQANLAANVAAGKGYTYAYMGPGTNTSPLPIIFSFLTPPAAKDKPPINPNNATHYTSGDFKAAGFVNALSPNAAAPFTFANNFVSNNTYRTNGVTAGYPLNFFVVNPHKLGGAFTIENTGRSYYDSLQFEVRRRLSAGLLVQGSYVFSKTLTNTPVSSGNVTYQPFTLRNMAGTKQTSFFGLTHAIKANWIWELPIGKDKLLAGGIGNKLDRLLGGWEFHGTARLQTGSPFDIGNVRLVGMTRKDLQKVIKMRFDDAKKISYYLPQDIIDNTYKAFNIDNTSQTGYKGAAPTGRYIAPASSGGCIEAYFGQCGSGQMMLYGPSFTRYDLSIIKRVKITERTSFEFRAEFLNAFNHVNFRVGDPGLDTASIGGFGTDTFGQVTNAYRDLSTTNDPGGRLIQFVGRFNF